MARDCRLSTIDLTAVGADGSISKGAILDNNTANSGHRAGNGVKSARSVKVDRRSLDWRAADVLREQILSGKLVPGQRVTETALAAQLEVSRGTLRAALRALAHEGLIQQVAY